MSRTPKILTASSYLAAFGIFGGFAATAVYAWLFMPAEQKQLDPLGIKFACVALVSLGWLVLTGLVNAALRGSFYSGLSGGTVSKTKQPVHFWLLLGAVSLLPMALIGYGIFQFVRV